MKNLTFRIYCDGGARGNPGPGAAGFVVFKNGKKFHEGSKYLGRTTNNIAEYMAVIIALEWFIKSKAKVVQRIHFYIDSELVVKQLNGIYKIKSANLKPLALEARDLQNKIDAKIIYEHVPRDKNKIADQLVNESLDENSYKFHVRVE